MTYVGKKHSLFVLHSQLVAHYMVLSWYIHFIGRSVHGIAPWYSLSVSFTQDQIQLTYKQWLRSALAVSTCPACIIKNSYMICLLKRIPPIFMDCTYFKNKIHADLHNIKQTLLACVLKKKQTFYIILNIMCFLMFVQRVYT